MIKPLNSIRFFFIFFIFLFHCRFLPINYFDHAGSAGVTFFFVISGFILSYNYKNLVLSNNFSKTSFMIKRFIRIYPIHFLVLLIYLILLFSSDASVGQYFGLKWALKLVLNIFLLQSYIPIETVFFSFTGMWFLSTLIFSYFIFNYLVILIDKYRLKSSIFLLGIPVLMFLLPERFSINIFYTNPIIRAFDFFAGMLCYEIYIAIQNKDFSTVTATLLEIFCVALWMISYNVTLHINLVPYQYSVLFWVPSICLIIMTLSKGLISKILSWNWLVKLGNLSFGFFVFHPTIIHFFDYIWKTENLWIKMVVIAIMSLICSYISLRYFEKPIKKLFTTYTSRVH
jgi:peptidoglycan/LPS O-acetylase OafA/YrhL